MSALRLFALRASVFLPCLSVAVEALAQGPTALEPIIITANRSAESASRTGSAITVISREQIEAARAENVLEVLETVPGLAINQAGGIGGATSVFMRGADSDQTQVLIDGVRVNDPGGAAGEFDFSLFSLANVERIEVLRGPQSGLYGSDAIGGVINIITRKGEGEPQATVEVEGGRYKTHAERAHVSGSQGGVSLSAGASNFRASGFSRMKGYSEDDATEKQSANLRLDADVTRNAGVSLSLGRYHTDADIDTSPQRGEDDSSSKTLSTAALTGRADLFDGAMRNTVTLFANGTDRTFFEDDWSSAAGAQARRDDYEGTRAGVEWQSDLTLREVDTLTVGARAERETGEQIFTIDGSPETVAFRGEERTSAAFALYQFNPIEALTLTAASRIEDFGSAGIEDTHRLTAAYRIAETGTKLRASYGTGAKAPTLLQRYSTGNVTGNPDLAVETSKGFDIGVDQTLLDGKVTLSGTYFQNDIENLIEFVGTDPNNFLAGTYENLAAVETSGSELAATVSPVAWLSLNASYTYLEATDAATGHHLARRPRHTAHASATLRPTDALHVRLSAVYVGERFNQSRERGVLDGYVRLDASGGYDLNENAEAFFRVENLFDAQYEEIQGFNSADRSAYAGLRVKF